MGPFNVILADPPWRFGDSLPGPGRGASSHYETMTVADICVYELPPIEPDAVLFMWRVAAMQEEALEAIEAWASDRRKRSWCGAR